MKAGGEAEVEAATTEISSGPRNPAQPEDAQDRF
jgi:hypothetical protein